MHARISKSWTGGATALGALLLGAIALLACPKKSEQPDGTEQATTKPQPAPSGKTEVATFGAGCFWHVESAFRQIKGVTATSVGFMGGHTRNPSYRDVCSKTTGHAEVVRVEYDPDRVSYEDLLKVFWDNHNPTTLNRQGPDFGEQYRSVIFYYTPEQEAAAKASKEKLQAARAYGNRPIVTEIEPAGEFYRAEEYHQQYYEKRGLSECKM